MKKTIFFLNVFFLISVQAISIFSQNTELDTKYRRSSLHTILIESGDYYKKDVVIKSFNEAPFPENYNSHEISIKSLNPFKYRATEQQFEKYGLKSKTESDRLLSQLGSELSFGLSDSLAKEYPIIIDNFLKKNQIAKQMVAKWFNRKQSGCFDMNLIAERGQYNANEMDVNIALNSARGLASLADAGEELINNTFIVFSRLNFFSNEIPALATRESAIIAANKIPSAVGKELAIASANAAYEKAKEGYTVWTTSYLYKLDWNDSVAAVFYNELWMDETSHSAERKTKFDETDIFKMKFIGEEKSSSLVTFSLRGQRTEEEIIQIATIRTIDNVYAKLQKEYDIFKPKVPLYSGNPITAKIGLKEGLTGKEKFEVLEQVMDSNTGRTKYVRKGIIKVDKKNIWDNRFFAGEFVTADSKNETDGDTNIDRTFFKGSKNKYYPGMLIKLLK